MRPRATGSVDGETYVVTKVDSDGWTVYRVGEWRPLFAGPFYEAWEAAREIARLAENARIVALNAAGSGVAQELFG